MYQDITLYPDSDRVDVKMHVNWNEDQRMIKISFPFAAESDHATYEIAYGALERPTTRDNSIDNAKFEVSGHKWADVTDDSGEFGAQHPERLEVWLGRYPAQGRGRQCGGHPPAPDRPALPDGRSCPLQRLGPLSLLH